MLYSSKKRKDTIKRGIHFNIGIFIHIFDDDRKKDKTSIKIIYFNPLNLFVCFLVNLKKHIYTKNEREGERGQM